MACAGSVNLIESMEGYDPTRSSNNYAAREGTVAHELARSALEQGLTAARFIGAEFDGIEISEEMATHVQLYLDHVLKVRAIPGVRYWVEKKFSLALLNPPPTRPMFGTSDHAAHAERTLYVDDLKYGQGVMVEIKDNEQTRYYALGVWLTLDLTEFPVDNVTMTIVQPRKEHEDGFIRTETISIEELLRWANEELLPAAHATVDPHAPLSAGSHCRFCPAKPVCPAIYKQSQEIAATEFDTMPAVVPPAPKTIPPEQFAEMLSKLHILDSWSASMKEHAFRELLAGRDVPGFKIVERRAERKWIDGIDEGENAIIFPPEAFDARLKSPAQVEKLVGKKVFKQAFASHVIKKSAGLKLVSNEHPSPAVALTSGEEFALLPAGDSVPSNEGETKEEKSK